MWAINSIDELSILAKERLPTAIFVATGFDSYAIDGILDAWDDIHHRSGVRWHLAIPAYIDRNSRRTKPLKSEYRFDFARDLMGIYGLKPQDTPCLVFETFIEENRQLHIKIRPEFNEFKKLILDIDEIIPHLKSDKGFEGADETWGRVYNRIAGRRFISGVRKILVPGTREVFRRIGRQGLG